MKFILLAVIGLMFMSTPAFTQTPDQCSTTPLPGSPAAFLIQKLYCRLQVEDNTRMASEEDLIIAQADQKIAEAKIAQMNDRLGKDEQKLNNIEEYWKKYTIGINKLTDYINAACSWRGVQNKPMSDLCEHRRRTH